MASDKHIGETHQSCEQIIGQNIARAISKKDAGFLFVYILPTVRICPELMYRIEVLALINAARLVFEVETPC